MRETGFTDISDPPKVRSSPSLTALGSIGNNLQLPEGTTEMRTFRLMHRLAVFAVAIMCVIISLESFSTAVVILRGQISRDLPIETYTANLITDYAGTTTIKESPLVLQVLEGSTSPLNISLYLETPPLTRTLAAQTWQTTIAVSTATSTCASSSRGFRRTLLTTSRTWQS